MGCESCSLETWVGEQVSSAYELRIVSETDGGLVEDNKVRDTMWQGSFLGEVLDVAIHD